MFCVVILSDVVLGVIERRVVILIVIVLIVFILGVIGLSFIIPSDDILSVTWPSALN
jgi:hypothetical protein